MTDPLEIAATALTLVCVILAVKRNLWQFPFGIVGTALGFFVFWNASLYSSAVMQPFFIAVQAYGWWFWLKGEKGHRPQIKSTNPWWVVGFCAVALAVSAGAAFLLDQFSDAEMAYLDAAIFGLSIVAQLLLDRKRIENWPVWAVINVISVVVYGSQGLWLYTALYAFFFFNAFWGWWEWRREMRGYADAGAPGRGDGEP